MKPTGLDDILWVSQKDSIKTTIMDSSSQKILAVAGIVFLSCAFVFLGACLFIFTLQRISSPPPFIETMMPMNTPIPLPASYEEVKENCSKGECLRACMAHANTELEPVKPDPHLYNGEEVDLVYYGISKADQLEKPRTFKVEKELLPYLQDQTAHQTIWNFYKALIPRDSRHNLVSFGLFVSSDTLGNFDTTVTENWITNINILALEDASVLSSVVVHEYGHYLTLNTTQMYSDPPWGFCKTPLYGCQTPYSYLNLFYLRFWKEIYPEWQEIDYFSASYESEIDSFYNKYKDQFLNDYAATDPIEDIAESWEAFVLGPVPVDDSIASQKVNFFYKFPELVRLKYQIIQGICTFEQNP